MEPAPPPVDSPESEETSFSILIADDDSMLRETLAEICEVAFDVITAASGAEAVDRLEAQRVDVALFDLQMGELSGLEVVRIVRVEYELTLPCLLMTAQPDDSVRREATQLGVCDLLEKPFPRRSLVESVSAAMEQSYGSERTASLFGSRRDSGA